MFCLEYIYLPDGVKQDSVQPTRAKIQVDQFQNETNMQLKLLLGKSTGVVNFL